MLGAQWMLKIKFSSLKIISIWVTTMINKIWVKDQSMRFRSQPNGNSGDSPEMIDKIHNMALSYPYICAYAMETKYYFMMGFYVVT